MNFYNLASIVASKKVAYDMHMPTDSFAIASLQPTPYIEPTFSKIDFETEKPQVVLISAVGATGKSTLAHVLSNRTRLPLLELGKHKPVGDNTLTGLLTSAFHVEDLSKLFQGIRSGTYGVIIDGIDEARSKTTQKAFEAFLDDVVRLCSGATTTSFVLLGRTQILEDCWIYLTTKRTSVGLVTIDPFRLDSARKYIDAFTEATDASPLNEYADIRDAILSRLGAAFAHSTDDRDASFLSFIGYPPVLDAIVALLSKERNYYRLKRELEEEDLNDVEIGLIYWVISYILRRERKEKVIPNIVKPLVAGLPQQEQQLICRSVFSSKEQCLRLVSHCLGVSVGMDVIGEPVLNEEYETRLAEWIPEHPFVSGREFRSAIFEASALATLLASNDAECVRAALNYADLHKHNYHLVYLLRHIATDGQVPIACLHVILGSAMEFRSPGTSVEVLVDGSRADALHSAGADSTVETEIEVLAGQQEASKSFLFTSTVDHTSVVRLGTRLSSAHVSLPCEVSLSGAQEVELLAPIKISATRIHLQSPVLVLRPSPSTVQPVDNYVVLEADGLESSVTSIVRNGVDLTIAVTDRFGVIYPAVQFVEDRAPTPADPALNEKFLRLKRILVHFRSHGKGALAKYRHKIEHDRILGRGSGRAILDRLLMDGILTQDGSFYFLNPAMVDIHLGVSWDSLRKGRTSEKLLQYLSAIG